VVVRGHRPYRLPVIVFALHELPQQIVFGLGLGAIYGLVAVGYSLIYRSMGLLSFVHPQFVMLGSVFGYTALATWHWSVWAAVVPVAVWTGAVSFLIDQIGLRPIRRSRGAEISMILATVGWGIVLVEVVRLTYGPNALSLRNNVRPPFHVLGVEVRWDTVLVLAVGAVFVIALSAFLKLTKTGRAVRAVGESSSTAALMGINVERMFGVSAAVSGVLGGVAGLFVGYLFLGGITVGNSFGVKSLAGAVLGGFGNLPGALVGGLIVGVMENIVAADISSNWRDAIVFGLIIAVLLVLPSGIFGRRRFVRS
jgi:branched-chain amino acid transport system permease protein